MAFDQVAGSNWVVVGALTLPHLLYAFIWFYPHLWLKLYRKDSVDIFAKTAVMLKGFQFSSSFYWYVLHEPEGVDLSAIPSTCWLLGLVAIFFGQLLNTGIYKAIGKEGVYYGFKLGHSIPWVDGFPFNVVRHPQYVGSVLTVWGAAALVWTQAPVGLGVLAAYWTGLYVVTGFMESFL